MPAIGAAKAQCPGWAATAALCHPSDSPCWPHRAAHRLWQDRAARRTWCSILPRSRCSGQTRLTTLAAVPELVLSRTRHPREPGLEIQPKISTPAASLTSPHPRLLLFLASVSDGRQHPPSLVLPLRQLPPGLSPSVVPWPCSDTTLGGRRPRCCGTHSIILTTTGSLSLPQGRLQL